MGKGEMGNGEVDRQVYYNCTQTATKYKQNNLTYSTSVYNTIQRTTLALEPIMQSNITLCISAVRIFEISNRIE